MNQLQARGKPNNTDYPAYRMKDKGIKPFQMT